MKKCTSSVHELIENVKGTPFGVETKKSKKGKVQNISFNETIDSFKDVIEEDCKTADKVGRFSDTPLSEGGPQFACEQSEADNAPCFQIGKLNSTKVLKSRLKKKYQKNNESYEDYKKAEFERVEKKEKESSRGIPEDIYFYFESGKLILKLNKKHYERLIDSIKKELRNNFKWDKFKKYWIGKNKNAEKFLNKIGIQEKKEKAIIKKNLPEKIVPVVKQNNSISLNQLAKIFEKVDNRLNSIEAHTIDIKNSIALDNQIKSGEEIF